MDRTVVITGSSGYLGSALMRGPGPRPRCRGNRPKASLPCPSSRPRRGPLGRTWTSPMSRAVSTRAFQRAARTRGGIDFGHLHFAVYYHYGRRWRREYDPPQHPGAPATSSRPPAASGAGRIIFAASIASLLPPPPGEALTEDACDMADFPYCTSKAAGERLCAERLDELPAVVMRIGGVFSDWCELPPLYSLIRLWSRPGPIGRCIPGRGKTGFPYIHRDELVRFVRRVIEKNRHPGPPRGPVCLRGRLHLPCRPVPADPPA
ncbi:MAG: NAD(P)-dependent oxidoreductase [Desulfosudis oleivorans]|nr:NAD(P)-dependent oxidoreductase [Desulfosudis oleivorans]